MGASAIEGSLKSVIQQTGRVGWFREKNRARFRQMTELQFSGSCSAEMTRQALVKKK